MPTDMILSAASLTMTSREIAELTGKEHKNVLRDIDNLLKSLGSDLSRGFSEAYEGDPTHNYRYFILDRDSTYCLMAGYDATARMKIIKRWQALESGEAKPVASVPPKARPREIREAFACCLSIAKAIGLKGNPAALAADIGTRKLTGQSALALIDQTHLKADPQGQSYTPTDLGKMLDPPLSARKFNALLEDRGLQTRDIAGNPIPTDSADGMYEWLDTNKRRTDGVPVKQLKWFFAVLHSLGVVH